MTKAYFVNHTHWDREWYFTTQDAQVLSDQLFLDVLAELEQHPEANFTLDGQMSIIDEFVSMHPEAKNRIKRLVNRKQLFVGPWYTQTDALLPTSESIIRNLVIGINDARKNYGSPMMIGYLPDTFGFSPQLPMLLNQVGIKDFIFWRGTNFENQLKSVYFKWKSLGNNLVYAANFPLGYYTGQISVDSKKHLATFVKERLDPGISFEANHSKNKEVLIPSGIDQMNIIHNAAQTLADINKLSQNQIFIGTYPMFMQKLHHRTDLETYQGELRLPTYSRVHRTIGSVRSQLKRQNFQLEQIILKRVEPLMIIAQKCGVQLSNGPILKLWKKLLECQPHDTLGGSVSDNVAVDIQHRFKEAFEIADGIENYIKKRISQRLHLKPQQVLVFNTDTTTFEGFKRIKILTPSKKIKFAPQYQAVILKEKYYPARENIMQQTSKGFEYSKEPGYYELLLQLKVDLPPLGYKVIEFQNATEKLTSCIEQKNKSEISNDYWKLAFHDGKIDLFGKNKKYLNFISILDSGNDGDTYDYSPLREDHEITLPLVGSCKVNKSKHFMEMIINGEWSLPYDLDDRLAKDPHCKQVPYTLKLKLTAHEKIINGSLTVNNTVLSHRLRLKVKTYIDAATSIALLHGGFIQNKNNKISKKWQEKFVEKPVNIFNFEKAVGLESKNDGLFVLVKGMKEYEKVDDNLVITLMSTTGQLGKPNLLWRPGRASGDTTSVGHLMTSTPLAQEMGVNKFEFGILSEQPTDQNELAKEIDKWLTPSISYQKQSLNLFINRLDNKIWDVEFRDELPRLNTSQGFLNLDLPVVVSAIYPAYTIKNAYVIRLANFSNQKIIDVSELKSQGYQVANALEEISAESSYEIAPSSMITLVRKYNFD
ncbi:alpha-mannosidase [Liquorilactobacillus ghanensis]|uniref:glycoside hydrolase family 38 N-terminal domain-containing protein n=1 Tax=Liquorilactobacillus ghanensis TaxID=399370 RepID=UPI0039EC07EA